MLNIFGYHIRLGAFILGCADFLILLSGFYVFTYFGLGLNGSTTPQAASPFFLSLTSGVVLYIFLFAFGIYEKSSSYNLRLYFVRLFLGFIFAVPFILTVWYLADIPYHKSLMVPVRGLIVQLALFSGVRFLVRFITRMLPVDDWFVRNIVIIGSEEDIVKIRDTVTGSGKAVKIIRTFPETLFMTDPDFELDNFCIENHVDTIVVPSQQFVKKLPIEKLAECRFRAIKILDRFLLEEQESGFVNLDTVYPDWIVFSDSLEVTPFERATKRIFDIAVSIVLLILCAPIMLITALCIRLESPGGVFYRQIRIGLNGKPFSILKFRSMYSDAERDGKARWADENDPRITRVGRFIRKTRLDEVPQFFNVLSGDMSIVGPRPERPEFVALLRREIPLYNERHYVKPGITGWAQINETYGASVEDAKRKLRYDLYYVKYATSVLDVLIVLKTVRVILWPHGVR